MKIDLNLLAADLPQIPSLIETAEKLGFDGVWMAETSHDPFLPLTLAAEHSRHILLGTGIAVALARSPATLAYLAWDLANFSQGRFVLGLGTQTNNHFQ